MQKTAYDAVVIGSGPNGLSAAIRLREVGLSVLLLEGKKTLGGGLRSAMFSEHSACLYDVCSAIHPLAFQSPFFRSLPLKEHGLAFVHPPISAVHPLADGRALALYPSLRETANQFGADQDRYAHLMNPLMEKWPGLLNEILAPLHIPAKPWDLIRFGVNGLQPASWLAKGFHTKELQAFWAGMAAHAMLPLNFATTSAIALVLSIAGHTGGWPIPVGGSQRIADALASYLRHLGGEIVTDYYVDSWEKIPPAKIVLFDGSPKALLGIAGNRLSAAYRKQLDRYRYGMGVFKLDWVLDGPVPFSNDLCKRAGTVHLGNSFEEIAAAEQGVWKGQHPENPFVLLAQQSLFDTSRAPTGKQVVWAYCHVPAGSRLDMTDAMERQVERFAPGFRDRILERKRMNAMDYEHYNPNYVGGDINGGAMDLRQLYTRPTFCLSPYKTSLKGLYICSASTPPGGGVHGMCGFHAANLALKEEFGI